MATSPAPVAPAPRRRTNELTSLLLVFPLFLIYQVGVLSYHSAYNGTDLVTGLMLRVLHGNMAAYVGISLALTVAFVVAVAVLRRKNEFSPRRYLPVLLESTLYAATMGFVIVFFMERVLHINPALTIAPPLAASDSHQLGLLGKIVLSCGAGVHEELIFRLILVPLFIWLFAKVLGARRLIAVALAFLVAALLFSAAHHVIGGEPWRLGVFVYRTLCGLIFAALFYWRGFAVDVYTHTLYDVFVFVLH